MNKAVSNPEPTPESTKVIPKIQGFGVAASPFNGVKIELGLSILFGALLWLAADSITADETTQWLVLLGYALISMCWLVLRTRAVLQWCLANTGRD